MKKVYAAILVILAIIATVMAIFYFTKTAGNLPHFFLGYSAGSTRTHTKHGIAFAVLAVILLLGAWMISGPKDHKPASTTPSDTNAS
jgi:hypothetical protein